MLELVGSEDKWLWARSPGLPIAQGALGSDRFIFTCDCPHTALLGWLHMELSSGPGSERRLNKWWLPLLFVLFLTVRKEVLRSSTLQTAKPGPRATFYAACALEFPINLIGLDIKQLVVHGIPESINNLPFTAPIH